jgi:predicted protein tyrosine phosphatase
VEFFVHTRISAAAINPTQPHLIISVSDPGSEPIVFPDNRSCRGVLRLAFYDLEQDPIRSIPIPLLRRLAEIKGATEMVVFDQAMADEILDFWLTHQGNVSEIHIHCDAAVSRSPAIAAALLKISAEDNAVWFRTRAPNMLVYRTLLERAQRRGLTLA